MSLIKSDFVIYLTGRIPYLGKFLLLSFNWKDFQKIRLQDTLIITTSWWNYWITGIQACPSLHIIAGGAQRLLKTNSFTENSIEWKIMWKYIYIYRSKIAKHTTYLTFCTWRFEETLSSDFVKMNFSRIVLTIILSNVMYRKSLSDGSKSYSLIRLHDSSECSISLTT